MRKGDIIKAENRKILVERHWGEIALNGSDDDGIGNTSDGYNSDKIITFKISRICKQMWIEQDGITIRSNTFIPVAGGLVIWGGKGEGITSDGKSILMGIKRLKLQSQDVDGFKAWLRENPTTIIYKLAEPVIEEVETDYTRLMLESYENATVYFNSHIFPTSTIRYTANIASVRSLMETNNEQDEVLNVSLMAIDESNTETGMLIDTLLLAVDELYTTLNPEEGGTLNE